MNEVKTETHFGKVYEIDKEYLFGNNALDLVYGRLKSIAGFETQSFETHNGKSYRYIVEMSACKDQGTITPAPVTLTHGKAYTYDCLDGKDITGLWSSRDSAFLCISANKFNYRSTDCTNIRPMKVVESSKTDE